MFPIKTRMISGSVTKVWVGPFGQEDAGPRIALLGDFGPGRTRGNRFRVELLPVVPGGGQKYIGCHPIHLLWRNNDRRSVLLL